MNTMAHANGVTMTQERDPSFIARPASIKAVKTTVTPNQELWDTGTYAYDGADNVKAIGVGIGIAAPVVPLHVVTTAAPENTVVQLENSGPARFRFRNNNNGETWNVGHRAPEGTGLVFSDVGDAVSELLLDVDGNLTIAGTLTAGNPPASFPDYVFAPGYRLMPLRELEAFVEAERRLPNMPSGEEIAAAGAINLSEFQLKLLEKIEELTLYVLERERRLGELQAEIARLGAEPGARPAALVRR